MKYFVAKGKAITTLRSVKEGGSEISLSDVGVNAQERIDALIKRGYVITEKEAKKNKEKVDPSEGSK